VNTATQAKAFEIKLKAKPEVYGKVEIHVMTTILSSESQNPSTWCSPFATPTFGRGRRQRKKSTRRFSMCSNQGVFWGWCSIDQNPRRGPASLCSRVILPEKYVIKKVTERVSSWWSSPKSMPIPRIQRTIGEGFGLCLRFTPLATRSAKKFEGHLAKVIG